MSKDTPNTRPERQPIPVEKLFISHVNPNGVKIPHGPNGEIERYAPFLIAGVNGAEKLEIEWRPWMRMYRIARFARRTKTGPDKKEIEFWVPAGNPFVMPETWAVAVLADE